MATLDHTVDEAIREFTEAARAAGCCMGRRIARDNILGQSPVRSYSFNEEVVDMPIAFSIIKVSDVEAVLVLSFSQLDSVSFKIIS